MTGDAWLDALQWPAMAVTVAAAWLIASTRRDRRRVGFWLFLASNVLWIAWGWWAAAWALVLLQIALAALNIRGAHKQESPGKRMIIGVAALGRHATEATETWSVRRLATTKTDRTSSMSQGASE